MRLSVDSTGPQTPLQSAFDDIRYRWEVRNIPLHTSESDLDNELRQLALKDGIDLPTRQQEPKVENESKAIHSSMSGVTVTSDATNMQSSIATQSTAPTSCSSSERRPPTRNSTFSNKISTTEPPQTYSPNSSKRNSAFRARMRKMVRLGKKDHTSGEWRGSLSDIETVISPAYSEVQIDADEIDRTPSVHSNHSNWSNLPAPKPAVQSEEVDAEALKRSLECEVMTSRQKEQLEERERFISYRNAAMDELRRERSEAKDERISAHEAVLQRKRDQDQQAIEELENRHLNEELRMAEEHKFREQMMNGRLKRIERFVHHPTPPPMTPEEDVGGPNGSDLRKPSFPPRSAGPADFNHLAEQYREQKNLVQVNVARINVLRGQQQKRLDALVERKDREMEALEEAQRKDLASIDEEFDDKEKTLSSIFDDKRKVLELYWWQYAHYELEKQQRNTGLNFQPLPPVTID